MSETLEKSSAATTCGRAIDLDVAVVGGELAGFYRLRKLSLKAYAFDDDPRLEPGVMGRPDILTTQCRSQRTEVCDEHSRD